MKNTATTKPKQVIDIDALVAEAVPPRPNPQLAFTMPVRVDSETNARESWQKKWKRKKAQQIYLTTCWLEQTCKPYYRVPSLPCVVRLTRVGQKRLDDDNLRESFKAIRDAIAKVLHCDDGSELVRWEYAQVAVGKRVYAVRVELY